MKFCSKCGEQNPDNARFCVKCGYEIVTPTDTDIQAPLSSTSFNTSGRNYNQIPTTYLWQSIVVTILCCWPLGIPAIVYASQVSNKFFSGDVEGAQRSSRNARNFCIWSLVGGIVIGIFIGIMYGLGIMATLASGSYID